MRDPQVAAGQERVIGAHLGPLAIREPVTVVHVTDEPAQGLWGLAFPLILVAQRVYLRRYLRALTG